MLDRMTANCRQVFEDGAVLECLRADLAHNHWKQELADLPLDYAFSDNLIVVAAKK